MHDVITFLFTHFYLFIIILYYYSHKDMIYVLPTLLLTSFILLGVSAFAHATRDPFAYAVLSCDAHVSSQRCGDAFDADVL